MNTDPNRLERRGAQRFEVHLPLAVHFDGRTVPGFIQDLSGRGVFFYAEASLPEGAEVELTFTMPSDITLAESMPVRCRGHVLRSSSSAMAQIQLGERKGVAVKLDSYNYLPAEETVAQFARVAVTTPGATSDPVLR
jgi:hypothetical protein